MPDPEAQLCPWLYAPEGTILGTHDPGIFIGLSELGG